MDSKRWRRATVLAVDDQPVNLVTLEAVLAGDFDVVRALSGEQALEILQSRDDIDVILLDVQMPGMDGFDAAVKMKRLPGTKDIPIVFITAIYNEDPFIKQGYQAGAVDYFTKPFDPEILRIKLQIYASFRQKLELLKEWERLIDASEELLAVGRKFSAMLEYQPMSVIVMDTSGHVRHMNSDTIDPGLDWWDGAGRMREGCSTAIAHVLEKGGTERQTVEVKGKDGIPRSLLCIASPLREPYGALAGVVLVVRDVTVRNQLEYDLERRIAGLVSIGAQVGAC